MLKMHVDCTIMSQSLDWMHRATRGDATSRIAINAGLTPSTLLRHVKDGFLTAVDVLKIAEGYGLSPAQALADAGLSDTPSGADGEPRLSAATDDELLDELRRRLI